MKLSDASRRKKRHQTIRKTIFGTTERPRLCVFRSGKHIYAQAIDDYQGKTLFSFSTMSENFKKEVKKANGTEKAKKLGLLFGPQLKAKGIEKIIFDRAGNQYHGRIKALADGLRESGVQF